MGGRRGALALAGLSLFAFVVSLALGHWLFPLGSINHDEPMYAFSARLLRDGHLTLPASFAPFRPWASGVRNGNLVLKYTPVWPAVLAAGDAAGSMRIGTALSAAGAVALIGLLGRELFGRWTEGLLAAAILVLSPLFALQSGTYLPYLFQLVLDLAVFVLLFGALHRWPDAGPPSRSVVVRLVAGGAVWGIALFARPYDAVLLAVPIAVAISAALWRRLPRLFALIGWVALGALLPVLALLAYDNSVMGGPFRSSFSITGPDDRLGFGMRGVFPTSTFHFTRSDGWVSLQQNLGQLPDWVFGGVVLVGLAAFGLWRQRRGGPGVWAAAGIALSFAVGYAVFWSPYSIVGLWPGARTMGPFYHLPLLIPLAVLGAAGLAALFDRAAAMGVLAVVILAVVTGATVGARVDRNRAVTRDYRAARRLVDDAHLGNAVLFGEDRGDAGFLSATPFLENDPSLRNRLVYAVDDGAADFSVIDRFPDRPLARLRTEIRPGDQPLDPTRFVERLHVVSGRAVTLRFHIVNTGGAPTVVSTLHAGTVDRRVVLDTASTKGETYDIEWTLLPPLGFGTLTPTTVSLEQPRGLVEVEAAFTPKSGATDRYQLQYPYTSQAGELRVLMPGRGRYLFQYGAPIWVNQDVSATLRERPDAQVASSSSSSS